MYKSEILKDSISDKGNRITTFAITFPRIVLAEFNTHRMFSRNFSSSRAIPNKKMIENIIADPFFPVWWGKNEKGMSASAELDEDDIYEAKRVWIQGLAAALDTVQRLQALNVHKQIVNRILEPWMFCTGIVTATEYNNFFGLRRSPSAQPEIKWLADMMYEEYIHNTPDLLAEGEWHIPMLTPAEESSWNDKTKIQVATGRLARVSYLTHEGVRDMSKDIELHDSLLINRHLSPMEHCAMNMDDNKKRGNFRGWAQYRKFIPNESGV